MTTTRQTPAVSKMRSSPSLLIDYSRNSAKTNENVAPMSLLSAARQRRSQRQLFSCMETPQNEKTIPEYVFLNTAPASSSDEPEHPKRISFKLRRSMVDPDCALLRLFSDSDLDFETQTQGDDDSQSLYSLTGVETHLLSKSNHTSAEVSLAELKVKRSRRNTLKETLKHGAHNLDTSPLCHSVHSQPFSLPRKSRSCQGPARATTSTSPSTSNACHKNNAGLLDAWLAKDKADTNSPPKSPTSRTVTSGPGKRTTKGRRRVPPRTMSCDANPCPPRAALATLSENNTKASSGSYLPSTLRLGKLPNRRTMMHKQASFVTGSRIRTLRP